MTELKCDMHRECQNPVTHIGSKGYVYCTGHANDRRLAQVEHTRKLRGWELGLLREGENLISYHPITKAQYVASTQPKAKIAAE